MTNWQRLEQVVKWSGMSTNKFAATIGLKRSENLYQIKRGNFGISKELARLICLRYPMISRLWLLTGEGQMLEGKASADAILETVKSLDGAVPFYNIDALQLIREDVEKHKPNYYLVLPNAKECSFAATCSGTSMVPDINPGATVVLREVDVTSFLPGEAYLIVTKDFATMKCIRTVDGTDKRIQLVPKNNTDFDTITIDVDKITHLYAIKAVISYSSI